MLVKEVNIYSYQAGSVSEFGDKHNKLWQNADLNIVILGYTIHL